MTLKLLLIWGHYTATAEFHSLYLSVGLFYSYSYRQGFRDIFYSLHRHVVSFIKIREKNDTLHGKLRTFIVYDNYCPL